MRKLIRLRRAQREASPVSFPGLEKPGQKKCPFKEKNIYDKAETGTAIDRVGLPADSFLKENKTRKQTNSLDAH